MTANLSKASDPDSSTAAVPGAETIATLEDWARRCVRDTPGLTQRELGARWCPEDPRRIGRRLCDMERKALVHRGDVRRCTISRRRAETWWPGPRPYYQRELFRSERA